MTVRLPSHLRRQGARPAWPTSLRVCIAGLPAHQTVHCSSASSGAVRAESFQSGPGSIVSPAGESQSSYSDGPRAGAKRGSPSHACKIGARGSITGYGQAVLRVVHPLSILTGRPSCRPVRPVMAVNDPPVAAIEGQFTTLTQPFNWEGDIGLDPGTGARVHPRRHAPARAGGGTQWRTRDRDLGRAEPGRDSNARRSVRVDKTVSSIQFFILFSYQQRKRRLKAP